MTQPKALTPPVGPGPVDRESFFAAVRTGAADLRDRVRRKWENPVDPRATGLRREYGQMGAEHKARDVTRATGLGGSWPVDLSMFLGSEARPAGRWWIQPRTGPGVRLWRLWPLGARVDAIFIGSVMFMLVYGTVIGLIATLPLFVEIMWDLLDDA